jgi:iron complex transport system substrate-binding protein
MKEKKKVLFVAFSVFLVLISLWTICGGSEITKWNSVTEDNSSVFSVDIGMDESKEVEFTVSSDFTCAWTWSVNEEEIKESEGESTELSHVFDEYGIYNVCVDGEGETVQACWNVTIWLVIGEENDVRELEGLEDYTLRISKRPERIVSMAPSTTEILFTVGAGDRVVGVTSFCKYPREVVDKVNNGEIEVIGGYSTPSFEKIVDLEPDLIVSAYGNPDNLITWLVDEEAHPGIQYPVYAQNPKNIEKIFNHIKVTGVITKCDVTASSLVNDLKERLEEIEEKTELLEEEQRPQVYYAMGSILYTAGEGAFQHDVIATAGGRNIAAEYLFSTWGPFSIEHIVEEDPQVIIYSSHGSESLVLEQIKNNEQLQTVGAVKNNRIYPIDEDEISRPGPRIVNATQTVYRYLSEFFEEEEDEETIPPEITPQEPVDTEINNIEGESRTFSISLDQTVDIVWQINGTEVLWNVTSIHGGSGSATANVTVTPSSTLVPGVTQVPEAETEIKRTPKPPGEKIASKEKATPVPATPTTPKSKSKPEPPGFEVFFAVIGLLAVMFLLRRKEV